MKRRAGEVPEVVVDRPQFDTLAEAEEVAIATSKLVIISVKIFREGDTGKYHTNIHHPGGQWRYVSRWENGERVG